jgi:hypothetical protein
MIELMVVVGIIIVLMSIMVPSINKARMMVMRGVCRANLRAIAAGCQQYAHSNIGRASGLAFPAVNVTPAAWRDINNVHNSQPACLWLLIEHKFAARELFVCSEAETRQGWKAPGPDDTQFTYNTSTRVSTLSYSYISMVDPEQREDTNWSDPELDTSVVILADDNPRFDFEGNITVGFVADGSANSANHKLTGQNVARLDGSADWWEQTIGPDGEDDIYQAGTPEADGAFIRASVADAFCLP